MDKIELTRLQRFKIEDWTFRCYPEEMCGFLTKDDFIPVVNMSENPESSFSMSTESIIGWIDKAIAIVHSHTREVNQVSLYDLRTPSYADWVGQKKSNLPWLIVGCEGITVSDPIQFPRVRVREYIGRPFQWFITDCYSLIQDFYYFELGIELPEAQIKTSALAGQRLDKIFDFDVTRYGFKEVSLDSMQDNDLILVDNGGLADNHLGIYTKGMVYHQDILSVCVPFGVFVGRVKKVLRYVG